MLMRFWYWLGNARHIEALFSLARFDAMFGSHVMKKGRAKRALHRGKK